MECKDCVYHTYKEVKGATGLCGDKEELHLCCYDILAVVRPGYFAACHKFKPKEYKGVEQ